MGSGGGLVADGCVAITPRCINTHAQPLCGSVWGVGVAAVCRQPNDLCVCVCVCVYGLNTVNTASWHHLHLEGTGVVHKSQSTLGAGNSVESRY